MVGPMFDEPTVSQSQALVRLASIYPIELYIEAKVERCRATKDLRNCGRDVQRVLVPCRHAALCEECSQRCDVCPICRIALPKVRNDLPLRLYYECKEAGLISKRCDDRLGNKEVVGEDKLIADVQRLYSLFDVGLENNLVSLICHYITDVCMDESAVSSDPVTAFLLDEKVVKDWCRRRFRNILTELQEIYNCSVTEMKTKLSVLQKISSHLAAMPNVVDVLESSFRGSTSAMVQDLNYLQESVSRTKQRYRYIEAYQVDCKLQVLEEDFISKTQSDELSYKVRSMSHWRKGLVSQSLDLLPDILKQQLKTGTLPEVGLFPDNKNISAQSDLAEVQEPIFGNLLFKAPQLQRESNGFFYPQP